MPRLIDPFEQFFDDSGDPLVSGLIDFFESGSNTVRKTTYADSAETIANPNPVVLSGAGRSPNVFGTGTYRAVLRTSAGTQILNRDPVGGIQSVTFGADWNANQTYSISDVVRDNGIYWTSATANNLGNQPSVDSGSNWVKVILDANGVVEATTVEDYIELRAKSITTLIDGQVITVTNAGIAGDFVIRNSVAHGLTDNGGTLIVINVDWYAERSYSGAVKAEWFGAIGGVTDYTTEIQNWLAVPDKLLEGAKGEFVISSPLVSAVEDRIIDGVGMVLKPSAAISTALLDLQADGQTIMNFDMQADAASECSGVNIGAYDGCTIKFNKLSNFDGSGGAEKGSGIICSSQGKSHYIFKNRLIACWFSHGADQYGSIHCNAGESVIEGNIITECGQTAVSVAGGSSGGSNHIQVIDNVMVGAVGAPNSGGVNFDGYTVGANISGNNIRTMSVEGILIAGSVAAYGNVTSDVSITNNTLYECVLNEFALQGSAAGDIERVLIEGNKAYRSTNTNQSFVMTNADHVDIFNNQIYGHDIGYIVTAGSRYHNVSGNTFINQDNTGIACFASESTYSNNKIYGDGANTVGMSFNAITIAGKMSIHGNQIRNCLTGINGTFNAALPVYVYDNNLGSNTTDLNYTGELADSSFDNKTDSLLAGEAILVAGQATVNTTLVQAGDKIKLILKTAGGTRGALYVNSITAGAGFVVRSTNAADTSTFYWVIDR